MTNGWTTAIKTDKRMDKNNPNGQTDGQEQSERTNGRTRAIRMDKLMDKGNPIYKPLLESGGILIDLLVIKCSITIKAVHLITFPFSYI